jgi:very-short-patch-repair endonuclease
MRLEPTQAEARLWAQLRSRRFEGIKFRRQHAIGQYVVDFCAPGRKLVIELDGSQHLDQEAQDARRPEFLVLQGYRVMRFWKKDVTNDIDGVMRVIQDALGEAFAPGDVKD